MKFLKNKNTKDAKQATTDIFIHGYPDEWILICKASSQRQGWMKSTKAMVCGGGILVQVTTEHRDENGVVTACAEALQFIPNATIDQDGKNLRIV